MFLNLKKAISVMILFLSIGMLSGCNTLNDAIKAKGHGPFKIYDVSADKMWEAMPGIIKASGLDYVSSDRQEGYLLAQKGISALSYGEDVAIFITALDDSRTRVEIDERKALATNIFATNWATVLFRSIEPVFKAEE